MKYAFLVLAAFAAIAGCGDKGSDQVATNSPSPSGGKPGAEYAAVQALLDKNCVGCHGGQRPKGNVTLTSYDALMTPRADGPIVRGGDAAGSILGQVLRATGGRRQMPPNGPMPEAEIATIEKWIENGAQR